MSNDLIGRKALINALFVRNGKMCPNTDIDNFPTTINVKDAKEAIRNAPTAYDVDDVVERLERDSQNIELIYPTDQGYDYKDAIGIDINKAKEIVKSGGIE